MMTNEHVSVVCDQANVAREQRRVILRLVAAGDICTSNISISTDYKLSHLHDQHQHHATCCTKTRVTINKTCTKLAWA
jgi:hypothetical protein